MAVGARSGMTGLMPGFLGVTNNVPQWVLNTAGCVVNTKHHNVPHPNVQSTADKHELRQTFKFVIYLYVGTPSRGASGHSQNSPNIFSSLGVILMLFS